MKFSHHWLQTFFDTPLPAPEVITEALTFHSSEVEAVLTVGDDTVYDIKVLPDKSAWLMSHRGLARELSVIFSKPLSNDPLRTPTVLPTTAHNLQITLDTPTCDFYSAALITGVLVGPSPEWLRLRLAAIGQRSINNIVDATNYVMFALGQPLHAFDASTFAVGADGVQKVHVRAAQPDESFETLSHEKLTLRPLDTVITDGVSGEVLALAGIKGGLRSGVTEATTSILLESAHFDRVATRLGAQHHKLPTDAAKRYENGLARSVAPAGLLAGAQLICEIAGGVCVGTVTAGDSSVKRPAVSVSLAAINRVLGITLDVPAVSAIFDRFGYTYQVTADTFTVLPPHEREDLVLAEDLIEEVGRIYGLSHIVAIAPPLVPVTAFNTRHYAAEIVRTTLVGLGFSEVCTSSFRNQDVVHLKNALASDKSYLRSCLRDNLVDTVQKNIPHRDLLGLPAIKIFEIGTVFDVVAESVHVGIGVQTNTTYKAKIDDGLVAEAQAALATALGVPLVWQDTKEGVSEFSLDVVVATMPDPTVYAPVVSVPVQTYVPFSLYPSTSRDIAMWVGEGTAIDLVESTLRATAGELLVRLTHLDTFTKDGRTSVAFRLVFQSKEKTLAASEVDAQMSAVYDAATKAGWEVR